MGDIVLEVNQTRVGSVAEFEAVAQKEGLEKGVVMLYIRRGKRNLFATLPMDQMK